MSASYSLIGARVLLLRVAIEIGMAAAAGCNHELERVSCRNDHKKDSETLYFDISQTTPAQSAHALGLSM